MVELRGFLHQKAADRCTRSGFVWRLHFPRVEEAAGRVTLRSAARTNMVLPGGVGNDLLSDLTQPQFLALPKP